jgi:hypothetical protein
MSNNHNDTNIIQECITLTNITLEQNYFQFDSKYYKQKEGLAMGVPTSATLSEIYLQYIEHIKYFKIIISIFITDM